MEALAENLNVDTAYCQYTTFYIGERLYGIDVLKVQEVTRAMPMSPVPLAPKYVHGLINLRGQIATAIGLRELFNLEQASVDDQMNIVCSIGGVLFSLIVDKIGDVIEVPKKDFESTPQTVSGEVRKYMTGVYKLPDQLLSIIDIETIIKTINV